MGYDVHITRSNDWTESSLKPIDIEEWKRLVDDDIEMDLTGVVYASTPSGQTLGYENEGLLYEEEEKPKSFFKRLLNLWK